MSTAFDSRPEFPKSAEENIRSYISDVSGLLQHLNTQSVVEVVNLFIRARKERRTVFIVGNGGSAATASHFANDLRVRANSTLFPIISLTDNSAVITAIANDFGFENIFVKQLETMYQEGDLLVAISASGNSPNVLKAIDYVNAHRGITIGLQGFIGGKLHLKTRCCISLSGAKKEYGPVEDVHLLISHVISACLN